jgi:hypothetical protein
VDRTCGLVLTGVIVIFAYVGSYLALVERDTSKINVNSTARLHARYRFGGTWAHAVFLPAHRIDRRLRRDHWEVGALEALELSYTEWNGLRYHKR